VSRAFQSLYLIDLTGYRCPDTNPEFPIECGWREAVVSVNSGANGPRSLARSGRPFCKWSALQAVGQTLNGVIECLASPPTVRINRTHADKGIHRQLLRVSSCEGERATGTVGSQRRGLFVERRSGRGPRHDQNAVGRGSGYWNCRTCTPRRGICTRRCRRLPSCCDSIRRGRSQLDESPLPHRPHPAFGRCELGDQFIVGRISRVGYVWKLHSPLDSRPIVSAQFLPIRRDSPKHHRSPVHCRIHIGVPVHRRHFRTFTRCHLLLSDLVRWAEPHRPLGKQSLALLLDLERGRLIRFGHVRCRW